MHSGAAIGPDPEENISSRCRELVVFFRLAGRGSMIRWRAAPDATPRSPASLSSTVHAMPSIMFSLGVLISAGL
jgi:hypothetical protein